MSNSLLTISMITKEATRLLKNSMSFAKGVNRQYDDQFANTGAKIGSVINIRKPVRFNVTTGAALQIQDVQDQSVALTLSSQKHVGFQFNSKDMTLSIDEFGDRYLKPAINALANQIDFDGLALANSIANAVGTPGTTPTALSTILAAGQKLDENSCPRDDSRMMMLNPAAQAGVVGGLSGLFQSSEKIAEQYDKGVMGMAAGFTFKLDQNIQSHVSGAYAGTPTVNGAGQTGSSLVTQAWTASIANLLTVGDVFTIAGVFAVNPVSFQSTGVLRQFVVTAAASSNGSGASTLSIFPSIITSGPYQTVTAAPANAAAITVLGGASVTSPLNLAFHKDAFVLGMADLALPKNVEMAARASDPDAGVSLRIVRAYDIVNDQHPCRIDVLYGWQAIYPEWAVRVQG